MTASAVARALKAAGFITSHLRHREGVRVKSSGSRIYVSADLDDAREAALMADALQEALVARGYTVDREPGAPRMYASR
jgi:hypothetical protein